MEQLRQVVIELQMAPTRNSIALQFVPRLFDDEGKLKDSRFYSAGATRMLDDLVWWATALKEARAKA